MKKRYVIKQNKKDELLGDRKLISLANKLNSSPSYLSDLFGSKKDINAATALALVFLKENYERIDEVLDNYFEAVR